MKPKAEESVFRLIAPKFGSDFLREAYAELRRVSWPTRAQALRLSLIVIAVSVAVGAYVGALDLSFTKLMSILLEISN